jgi:hypothetical protein
MSYRRSNILTGILPDILPEFSGGFDRGGGVSTGLDFGL